MPTPRQQALKDRHRPSHATRTADSHAAFLLPYLKPGLSLLDVGCGPGSITVGLAAAVAPGPTMAVDLDPGLPADLQGVAVSSADACSLPFPDQAFDAIYMGAVLQHLPSPLTALQEARRVASPGAVIGVADADWGGHLLAPTNPVLERSFALMENMHTGSPYVGRRLRGLLADAGFARCEARATARHHGTPEEVTGLASFNAAWFTTAAIIDTVVERGWATPEEMASTSTAWLEWGTQPGAFFAGFWCEAIGWVD